MNEQEWANRFQTDVNRLLAGKNVPPTDEPYDGLLNLAHQLVSADFSADSAIRETLKAQLLENTRPRTKGEPPVKRRNALRPLTIAAAVLLMLTVATLTIPPLRAFAQEVLAQIGNLVFTNDETIAQKVLNGEPPPTSMGTIVPYQPPPGSPPFLPGYLPARI